MEQRVAAVDVVIPVRNGERFVEACLDSVRSQVLQPATVVVVDDGSTDRTAAILNAYQKRWNKLQVIRSDPRGVSHARNLGLAACTATYVAFLDADDVWLPEKLRRQVLVFSEGSQNLGFVHCGYIKIDRFGQTISPGTVYSPTKRGGVLQVMLIEFYPISGSASAVVARRDLVLRVGGFDEGLTCGEDLDLWLKLAEISDVDFVPDPLVGLRLHTDNSCKRANAINPELVLFQRLKIWSRWLHLVHDQREIRRAFRKEALRANVANSFRRRPSFGLYGRLIRSELPLARELFRGRWDYYKAPSRAFEIDMRIRQLVADHLISKSPALLRLFQRFGRLRDMH